ncbi:MAG: hypothetical protein FD123_1791 [Bacteroidetes bacterium]|nr:MAG: hypothetical protein FD123_1791 [Bacteroidota bacterium]
MLFDDTYRTIESPAKGLFKDRGSKFIGYAYPVSTEAEVKEHIALLRREHFDARHHCYAFRIGPDKQFFRANDDGEPSGTAGRPILGQLQSQDLTNVLVVVVRYFGGTLLGVSGLINAYRAAAADALSNATIVERTVNEVYELLFPYAAMNDVMKIMKEEELEQWDQQFELDCRLLFSVRKSIADNVTEKLKKTDGVKVVYVKTV